jgi:hypothetical protein
MLRKITFLVVFAFNLSVLAQQDFKFGKVSKEAVKEKLYPLDSTADAAYLYKYRRTYFEYNKNKGFMMVSEIKERIKIYTKEGFRKATKSIVYYKPESGDNEKITSIKGYTFNLKDGKIDKQKLSKSSIFDEQLTKYRSSVKITFPNIKEGAVIDLEYKIESPYDRVVDDVNYQFDIPVKYFYAEIRTPEYYTFKKKGKGYFFIPVKTSSENGRITMSNRVRAEKRNQSGGLTTTSEVVNSVINLKYNIDIYELEDIPALNDKEPFITDIKNYRGGVEYELESTKYPNSPLKFYSTSWEDVSKQIYKSTGFGSELDKNNYFKDDLENLLKDSKVESEKIVKIFEFVKQKVKWNNYYGKYVENGVKKAYKDGSGNIAEINIILTSMLQEAGIDAYPVLASTRRNGIPIFPTLDGFNYVLTMVKFPDNSYMLLDASEPYSAPNVLPERILNWNGRIVTESGASSWVKLTPSKWATEDNIAMVKITDDLTIEGLIRTKYQNLSALKFRTKNNKKREEDLITNFEEAYGVEVENFKVSNGFKLGKPVTRSVKFSSDNLIEEINGKLYIEPLLFLTQRENPFKLEDRKYPVDFASPLQYKNSVSIQIPAGYKIESLPETMAIGLPDKLGLFKYQIISSGNKVKVISVVQFNSPIIVPQHYQTLKKFYGDLVKKETEKIVLVKM